MIVYRRRDSFVIIHILNGHGSLISVCLFQIIRIGQRFALVSLLGLDCFFQIARMSGRVSQNAQKFVHAFAGGSRYGPFLPRSPPDRCELTEASSRMGCLVRHVSGMCHVGSCPSRRKALGQLEQSFASANLKISRRIRYQYWTSNLVPWVDPSILLALVYRNESGNFVPLVYPG